MVYYLAQIRRGKKLRTVKLQGGTLQNILDALPKDDELLSIKWINKEAFDSIGAKKRKSSPKKS
ncbi:hypothetical protein BH10CYA1_BH10CYA1_53670 [soil metagenome]